jgi:hypothetical protein
MASANDGRITNPLAYSAEQSDVSPADESVPAPPTSLRGAQLDNSLAEREGLHDSTFGRFNLDSEFQLRFLLGVLRAALDPCWLKPEPTKPAAKQKIQKALAEIYEEAKAAGTKPPNVNEAYRLVVGRVAPQRAPKSMVMTELKAFAKRRLGRGKRFDSK